jgi:predicted ATPase
MQLTRIKVEGYKSFKSLDVEMRPLNVLIGANGAGKSNFLSLFHLLHEMSEGRFQKSIVVGGGADTFLHYGQNVTSEITVTLNSDQENQRFFCKWIPSATGSLIFNQESIAGLSYSKESLESPFFEYCDGKSFIGYSSFASSPQAMIQMTENAAGFFRFLQNTRFYHLNDTGKSAPFKKQGGINDDFYLRSDGENLAAYLFKIKHKYPKKYEFIRKTIRLVAPYFDDFVLRPMPLNENYIRLEWREQNSDYPFGFWQLPDGLIRFMCLATLLMLPKEELPSLILIDEPELSLHPSAINILASLIRLASANTQIVIATQSVAMVDQFEPEELLVVERRNGATVIERQDPERLQGWLERYSLGELWEKNVLGGRPSR